MPFLYSRGVVHRFVLKASFNMVTRDRIISCSAAGDIGGIPSGRHPHPSDTNETNALVSRPAGTLRHCLPSAHPRPDERARFVSRNRCIMPFIKTASVSPSDMNQCSTSISALTMLLPSHPFERIGMSGMTTMCSPNLVLSQLLLRTQSVMYCADPTSARCEMDPSATTVPVPSLLVPTASARAWMTSCRLPSSTLTTRMHSSVSEAGAQAGKD